MRAVQVAVQPDVNAVLADGLVDPIVGLLGPNPDAAGDASAHDSVEDPPGPEDDEDARDSDDDNDEDEYDNDGIYDSSDDVADAMGPPYYEDSDEDDSAEEWRDHIVASDA